jgi:hypothetical protein
MKIDINEINAGDVIMTPINIGNLPPKDVDKFCKKNLKLLKDIFGCQVAIFPTREGDWDFTIVRNPTRKKIKKVA